MTTIATSASMPVQADANRHPWLHRFSFVLAILTFLLIVIGSTVTTTDSGLSVPDWPTTFGENMFTYPISKWVDGVQYEHGHRLVASLVGFMTIVLCVWLWRTRYSLRIKWLGVLALISVCFQGVLGGLTVLWGLPVWVSVSHAALAQIFLMMILYITWITARAPGVPLIQAAPHRRLLMGSVLVAGLVFLQILVGAWMRHEHAGQAITDFPLSYGSLIPPTTEQEVVVINQTRRLTHPDLLPVSLDEIWIHFSHRLGYVILAIGLIALTAYVLKKHPRKGNVVLWLLVADGLLVAQLILGAMTVWRLGEFYITTLHIAVGVLMMMAVWMMVLSVYGSSGGASRAVGGIE